jgi:hypothetical protein
MSAVEIITKREGMKGLKEFGNLKQMQEYRQPKRI